MRILFALAGLHRVNRGAEVAFISIALELARTGHKVALIGSGPPISDSMLAEFTTMPKLTALYVTNDNISDAGIKHLARMTQLEVLDLRRTSITDRGLRHLESLKNLKVLCLAETQVTDIGIEHFKLAVPGCDVRR